MHTNPALTRRERQAAVRRDQILVTAARLFAERGYHRVTTKEIAAAADVAEGTIYNYFKSKEDILLGFLARMTTSAETSTVFDEGLTIDLRSFLLHIVNYRKEFMRENGDMYQAILSEILASRELGERFYQQLIAPTMAQFEQHLQKRIDQGQLKPMDVAITARAISALLSGLSIFEMIGDPVVQNQHEEFGTTLVDMILDTILADGFPPAGKPGE